MDTSSLMEQILSKENLNTAYLQVVRNKGAEGVDGMKYTELKEHLAKNGEIIKEQLRTRKYMHIAASNGRFCGEKRPQCEADRPQAVAFVSRILS